MESKFYDGLFKISAQGTIVRMCLVNIVAENGKNSVSHSEEIVMPIGAFCQMFDSMKELMEQISIDKNSKDKEEKTSLETKL